ncbi:hypothetical protein KIS4809_0236 [Bacillus sp. ZZV12-4809]|nr:hypothetical protein KIS4809_0236 [Bacillus sp. ZZV12-4809]
MRTEKGLSANQEGLCAQKKNYPPRKMGYAHKKGLSAHQKGLCAQKKVYPPTKKG